MTDELTRRLRGQGTIAVRGVLSLDRDKAREKMRLFRLPNPSYYVLQFVRAASVLGAPRIEFTVAENGTTSRFEGVIAAPLLEDVWAGAFDRRETPEQAAVHNIALGIASAQALTPRQIVLESGARRVRFTDRGEEIDALEPAAEHTTITVQEKFRAGHFAEFVLNLFGELSEEKALRERCWHSELEVFVNGVLVSLARVTLRGLERRTQTRHASNWVVVDPLLDDVQFTLLRDDVRVGSAVAESVGLGAVAVMNSRIAQTDLTGLAAHTPPADFTSSLYELYHLAVHEWIATRVARRRLDAVFAQKLIRMTMRFVARVKDPPAGTRTLWRQVLELAAYPSAVAGAPPLSVADATRSGTIRFSTRLFDFPGVDACVVWASSVELAAYRDAGFDLLDVTADIERAERAYRNEQRLARRPVRPRSEPPPGAIVVERGGVRAVMTAARSVGTVEFVVDGRVVRENFGPILVDIEIDGSMQLNDTFDDVVRDDLFDEIAVALVDAAPRLFPRVDHDDDLIATITMVAQGRFAPGLLRMLGYDQAHAANLGRRTRFADSDTTTLLGQLADAPIFDGTRQRHTLREIATWASAPLIVEPGETMFDLPGRLILCASTLTADLVRLVRPDAGPYAEVLERERAEARFLESSLFELVEREPRPLLERCIQAGDVDLQIQLFGSDRLTTHVYFLRAKRLLASRVWRTDFGDWRVVVHCSGLRPTTLWNDVEEDDHFAAIKQFIERESSRMLGDWSRNIDATEMPEHGLGLFIALGLTGEMESPRLLAMLRDRSSWRRVGADAADLRRAAQEAGVIRYVGLEDQIPPNYPEGTLVALVRGPIDVPHLQRVVGPWHVENVATATQLAARSYAEGPEPPLVEDWLWRVRKTYADELAVETKLRDLGADGEHTVVIVYRGRVLEEVTLRIPVGRFHSIVSGPPIQPDARYRYAARGRVQALTGARRNEEVLVDNAARWFEERGGDAVTSQMKPLSAELLRFARTSDRRPAFAALRKLPLITLPAGKRTSVEASRRDIHRDDVLSGIVACLHLARDERRDLLDDFLLGSIGWVYTDTLCTVDDDGVALSKKHELVRLASEDNVATAFLASCVCSRINAHYREISDADELELQRRLLKAVL